MTCTHISVITKIPREFRARHGLVGFMSAISKLRVSCSRLAVSFWHLTLIGLVEQLTGSVIVDGNKIYMIATYLEDHFGKLK